VNKPIGFYQFRDVMSKVKSLNPHKVDDNNAIIEIDLSTMKKFASELEPVDISQIVKNILSQ
jgi:ribosomal protein L12E/L44/L45/RPP1/RPP2